MKISSRSGLTVMEILLALAVATLVVTAALSLYSVVRVSLRQQTRRSETAESTQEALRLCLRDLACAIAPPGRPGPVLRLVSGEGGHVDTRLEFYCTSFAEGGSATGASKIERVSYTFEKSASLEAVGSLSRVSALFAVGGDAPAPERDTLVGDVIQFDIQLYDGNEWISTWGSGADLPKAARVEISVKRGDIAINLSGEVLVACGHTVTPGR